MDLQADITLPTPVDQAWARLSQAVTAGASVVKPEDRTADGSWHGTVVLPLDREVLLRGFVRPLTVNRTAGHAELEVRGHSSRGAIRGVAFLDLRPETASTTRCSLRVEAELTDLLAEVAVDQWRAGLGTFVSNLVECPSPGADTAPGQGELDHPPADQDGAADADPAAAGGPGRWMTLAGPIALLVLLYRLVRRRRT